MHKVRAGRTGFHLVRRDGPRAQARNILDHPSGARPRFPPVLADDDAEEITCGAGLAARAVGVALRWRESVRLLTMRHWGACVCPICPRCALVPYFGRGQIGQTKGYVGRGEEMLARICHPPFPRHRALQHLYCRHPFRHAPPTTSAWAERQVYWSSVQELGANVTAVSTAVSANGYGTG